MTLLVSPIRRWFTLCLLPFCVSFAQAAETAGADPGELDIRPVLPLDEAARARLAELIARSPEARAMLAEKQAALAALADARPRPLEVIVYEGRLNTDPARIATVRHLHDFDHAGAFFEVWQAVGDEALADRLRAYVSAWAGAYRPTGNDVNEYKLLPLLVAYVSLRPSFEEAERERIDAWMRALAEPHRVAARDHKQAHGNRYAKRLGIVATIGLALDEPAYLDEAVEALRVLVNRALLADGTSLDFRSRDTLTYHTTTIRPLLDVARLARGRGEDLYVWEAPGGGSIKRSTDFILPYARGEKVHAEWVNTTVELDRRRAAAGIEHYQPGRPYEPRKARPLFEEAELFDPSLTPLVAELAGRPGTRFPTWRLVLNAALRGD
jgi:hypothetical protein